MRPSHLLSALLLLLPALALAAEPAARDPLWGQEPVEAEGPLRGTVCLNGAWRFQPGGGDAPLAAAWGWIRVPGAWSARGVRLPGLISAGTGAPWTGLGTDQAGAPWAGVGRGWYERELVVPAAWAGRRIRLDLERVSTAAEVWVDGQPAGKVGWPGGQVDLTPLLKPGTPAVLRLRVATGGGDGEVEEHTGAAADQVFTRKQTLAARGLIGDVLLRSDPLAAGGARIAEVAITTSTRQGRIDLGVALSAPVSGPLNLRAAMADEAGTVEKTFTATATADATGAVQVGWAWPGARRWDIGQPRLYTLRLAIDGAGIADELHERFGFREVWLDGRNMFLNGSVYHPRPAVVQVGLDKRICTLAGVDAVIDGFQANGFDSQEMWPWNQGEPGVPSWHGLWYRRAAERGWGVFASLPAVPGGADGRAEWTAQMRTLLARWRNNPAILGWVHTANQFGTRNDQDPRVLGDRAALLAAADQEKIAPGLETQALLRKLDPTRPAAAHQGGPVGDLQTVNFYPCLQPTQEVEEWLTRYVQEGDIPFWPVESGPFYLDYRRGRMAGGWNRPQGTIYTELVGTEFLAAAFGNEAYRVESPAVRALNPSHYEGNGRYRDIYKTWLTPLAEEHQGRQIERIVRAWRALGAPLLPIPWELELGWDRTVTATGGADGKGGDAGTPVPSEPFAPGLRGGWLPALPASERWWLQPQGSRRGPRGDAIARAYAATLVFIAGPQVAGDISALTAKDHAFTAGTAFAKQVVLINDSRQEQSWSARWTVRVGAWTTTGEASGTIATGAVAHAPFTIALPADLAAGSGTIELTARIGASDLTDRFAFTVFAAPVPLGLGVTVVDPRGASGAWLRRLGCREQADGAPLTVIGRNALVDGALTLDQLTARARAGERFLVLAQDPAWLRATLGWRVGRQVVRQVYAVDPHHPLMTGLADADFADWAGAGSLVEPRPAVPVPPKGYPPYGWHWGNRGSVASAMIEKPHRSAWRPLLEGDFDLAYTPLMELELGRGRIVWCGLDFEERGATDPAADRLAANLLRYSAGAPLAASAPAAVRAGIRVSGDAKRWLDACGVRVATTVAANQTLVLGTGGDRAAAEAHLATGGTVLCLAPEVLGLATSVRTDASGAPDVPDFAWCRGLSRSLLRLRCPAPQRVLTPVAGWTVAADGLLAERQGGPGRLLVCLLDPEGLPVGVPPAGKADAKSITDQPYLRLSRWRRLGALSQVLANLGAEFASDGFGREDWYRGDWLADQNQGDDPHRYYRW